MRARRSLTRLAVVIAAALAIYGESAWADDSACTALAVTLPPSGPSGTTLNAGTADELLAKLSGSVLNLKPTVSGGLMLGSTYAGSLNCQSNNLSQAGLGGREQVSIPERFQGGEGALCGTDKVQLVAVNGTPALLEISSDGDSRIDLDIALRSASDWSIPCRLTITLLPRYGITEQFCGAGSCQAIAAIALRTVNSLPSGALTKDVLIASELSTTEQARWTEMKRLAEARQLMAEELPTFGQDNGNGRLRSFLASDAAFTPIQPDGRLLLGKIGTAGFGSHFGSDKLFAAYRLAEHQFQPVAGFYLSVVARSLSGYRVATSP